MKSFQAIGAMSLNRAIGHGNRIPWHLPEELRWFKQKTNGHLLVMGRKTFESIGRLLPGRETIVVSRREFVFPGVRTVGSLEEIELKKEAREVFICGGAEIYALALPHCSDLFLTLVKRQAEGDAYFPPFEHLFAPAGVIAEHAEFTITHYQRVKDEEKR